MSPPSSCAANHARPARSRRPNLEAVPGGFLIVPDLLIYIDSIKYPMLSPSMQSEKIVLILTVGVSATPLQTSIISPIGVFLGSSNTHRKYSVDIPCALDARLVVGSGLLTRKLLGLISTGQLAAQICTESRRDEEGLMDSPSTMEALLQCHSPRRVKCYMLYS
ncbi:hypothetical protein BDR04DRAFT_263493 [Suillus decipiens]|nr:hypothetical protein BDR04DRAFT_263493 [Suillus decipiens]